jgi:CubicO group peptidase (beta-lactamase class C family)
VGARSTAVRYDRPPLIEADLAEADLKTLLAWVLAAMAICAVLVVSRDPARWLGAHTGDGCVLSFDAHSVLRGSNQPAAPREKPEEEQMNIGALETASEYAESTKSRALIVTRNGYIVYEKYWQGSAFDTVVDSRGLGRVLAALATGAAIGDRKIAWPDEPLGYLMSEWNKETRGTITVRNLLQLSSGLGRSGSGCGGTSALAMSLAARPGTRWLDQEADPDLLGHVIQQVTGRPYASYLSESIWARIGAGDASLALDHAGGEPHVNAGFTARQGDWLRVAELLMNNGNFRGDEVLSPRWVPEMLKPAPTNERYGSYVRLGSAQVPGVAPYASRDLLVVEGGGNRMWLIPSLQIAILRTGDELPADWDDSRIPNLVMNGTRDFVPAAARPGADLRLLVPNH